MFGPGGGTLPVLGRSGSVIGYVYRPPHPLCPPHMGQRPVPPRPYAVYCVGTSAGGYCVARGGGMSRGEYVTEGGMLRVVTGDGCQGAGAAGGPGGPRV